MAEQANQEAACTAYLFGGRAGMTDAQFEQFIASFPIQQT
jgi:hypothetical protein